MGITSSVGVGEAIKPKGVAVAVAGSGVILGKGVCVLDNVPVGFKRARVAVNETAGPESVGEETGRVAAGGDAGTQADITTTVVMAIKKGIFTGFMAQAVGLLETRL